MVLNTVDDDVAKRRYTLTKTQEAAVRKYKNASVDQRRVSALLQLSRALIACNFEGFEDTSHPIICFTIISNTKPGGLVADPLEVSPFLAALQYFCRATMFLWGYSRAALSASGNPSIPVPDQLHAIIPTQMDPSTQMEPGTQASHTPQQPTVTLFDSLVVASKWLKDGDTTPFAYIQQMMRLSAMLASSSNRMGRFIWDFNGAEHFSFDGNAINYTDFRHMMSKGLEDVSNTFLDLWESFDLPKAWLIDDLKSVGDELASRAENYNYVRHGGNVHVTDRARQVRDHIVNCGKFFRTVDNKLFPLKSNMKKALALCEAFVKELAAIVYLLGGQPPRGSEHMATLIANLSTRIRNFIIAHGVVFIISFLNKTTFTLNADKAIPRMFPHLLAKILINYISFIRIIEHLFLRYTHKDRDATQATLSRLFHVNGRQLGTPDLTESLKRITRKYLKVVNPNFDGFGTAELRQILIYISTRFIRHRAHDKGDETQALMDIQAGHSSEVARKYYGVEMERLGGTVDSVQLEMFHQVSLLHHKEWKVEHMDWRHAPIVGEPLLVSS
jgi:hypothetical protein